MYTKIGLSLLAVAGLAVGAIGMETGGASGATATNGTSCVTGRTGAANGTGSGSAAKSPSSNANQGNTGTNPDGTSTGNGTGNGSGGETPVSSLPVSTQPTPGTTGGSTGTGGTTGPNTTGPNTTGPNTTGPNTTVSTPNTPTTSTGTTQPPFLDLGETSTATNAAGGTVVAPPTHSVVVGRSSYLGSLIQITGRANAGQ